MTDDNMDYEEVLETHRKGLENRIEYLTLDIEEAMPEGRSEEWKQRIRKQREKAEKELEEVESKLSRLHDQSGSNSDEDT